MTHKQQVSSAPLERPRPTVFSTLRAAFFAFVLLVIVATSAVAMAPHTRGIGFVLSLRFGLLVPACGVVAVGAVFLHRTFGHRRVLTIVLGIFTIVVLVLTGAFGGAGLLLAIAPAVVSGAIVLALLVPRFASRPPRRVGTVALVLLGALEILVGFKALASEGAAPPGPDGLAFEIPRAMFDADHKFMELPSGARIHYIDEGKGNVLLFLHGNPAWSFQWRDLVHGLRGSYRCVALDYPGFGLSDAPTTGKPFGYTPREESLVVEELVDRLGLRDITLVMQDWGGPIGIGFAERRPELVRQVVLGSTWAWPTGTDEPRGKWSVIAGGPIGEFMQVNFNGIAVFGLESSILRPLPPAVADVYLRPFRPLDRRGIAAFYPKQITAATDYFAEIEAGLPRLAGKKALIFWALQDPGFLRRDLERWEQAFSQHKTIELAAASHFFFEDATQLVVDEIGAFASTKESNAVAK